MQRWQCPIHNGTMKALSDQKCGRYCSSEPPCKDGNVFVFIFVKKQSQELTRVNPDRNIFSINVEQLLYRGLVYHDHRVFKCGRYCLSELPCKDGNVEDIEGFPEVEK